MTENDTLRRFMFDRAPLRGEHAHLDETWRAVLARRDYPPLLRGLLGELMAAAALLSSTIKFDGALVIQMHGDAGIKLLVVECTSDMSMRATAHWAGELRAGPLPGLLGRGRCAITISRGDGKQNYQGIVELRGDTIAQVLENYMARSEQLVTRLWLAADEQKASGLLLQLLPEQHINYSPDWDNAVGRAATLSREELLALPTHRIIQLLYHEHDVRLFSPKPCVFQCTCTRQRVADMLRMLGQKEV
ncbi:MAG: Hsp33 family molecular chaperone HslO, partial [Burkholderiales bacterium]